MTDPPASQDELRREAQAWVARLTSGDATDADAWRLALWRRRSPAHEAALRDAARLWSRLVPAMPREGALALPPAGHGRRGLLAGGTALAASAGGALLLGQRGGWVPSFAELGAAYRTGTGERRRLALPDGSLVEMNTRTSLSLRFTAGERRVLLLGGEASFTVVRDAERPFVVASGGGETRVLGTVFNILMEADAVSVTDLEGRVAVQAAGDVQLGPGEQVSYGPAGLGARRRVDLALVAGWRQGLLVFRDRSIRTVVAEINRYRPGHILLLNEAAAQRQVSGVFHLDRLDQVVAHLREVAGLQERALPGGLLILR
ncbi:FecR family protein [Roseicella frigidaeris]|uniref:Histidine kinase n=1 Tax=Roseicella frigidaeris TaxID=2230885 RepID=A0A327MG73_9PROT|nr:FecR family protein [Roseicella frigidaeris]RAI61063.1 histidine kinase [Roseicella frigidaeris]